jgi:Na+/phosphate symporter
MRLHHDTEASMDDRMVKGIEEIASAVARAESELAAAGEMMLNAFAKQQEAFEQKKKRIEEEIQRGARLTKHRISL